MPGVYFWGTGNLVSLILYGIDCYLKEEFAWCLTVTMTTDNELMKPIIGFFIIFGLFLNVSITVQDVSKRMGYFLKMDYSQQITK